MTSRNFCFTLNNPIDTTMVDTIECKYIVYGHEVAPSTGTPHLQGVVVFHNKKALSGAIKALPGCHVEITRDLFPAILYCKKEGDWKERGIPPHSPADKGSGEKRRWDEILQAAKDGRFEEIPSDLLYHSDRHKRIRTDYLNSLPKPDTEAQMLWYYGPPGTGKSRKAREENPGLYLKMCSKWWDDYSAEEVVLIEDFDKSHEKLAHHLKIWGDRYPFPAEYKGGKFDIRPRLIIVTSNWHPRDIWSTVDLDAILRRFKCVKFGVFPEPLAQADNFNY